LLVHSALLFDAAFEGICGSFEVGDMVAEHPAVYLVLRVKRLGADAQVATPIDNGADVARVAN
jgi:hypothetical protein